MPLAFARPIPYGVFGPASSTDNAIVRFDGTNGKKLQSSGATITDAGSLDLPAGQAITIGGAPVPWDQISKAGSSLAQLATRSAGDLDSGNLDVARMPVGGTWNLTSGLLITGDNVTLGTIQAGTGDSVITEEAGVLRKRTINPNVWSGGTIDISADTNLSVSAPLLLTDDDVSLLVDSTDLGVDLSDQLYVKDAGIDHDQTTNFVADEHVAHSGVSISAGGILSGGGDISASRTISLAHGDVDHDQTLNFVLNEHVDHSLVSISAGGILSGGGDLTADRTISLAHGDVDHDQTLNFAADKHVAHSGVSISAGGILSGGGDITASRTITLNHADVDHDQLTNTHQDVSTTASPTFDQITLSSSPAASSEAATKGYVDGLVQGLDWQDSVLDRIDFTTAEPAAPTEGDRYISLTTGTSSETATAVNAKSIYEWVSGAWVETVPNEGTATWVEDENVQYVFNSSAWVKLSATTVHNNLSSIQGGAADEYYHLDAVAYGYLSDQNQHVRNTDGPTFAGLTLTAPLETDEVQARSASGLGLYDDAGNGVLIADGGDLQVNAGGIYLPNNKAVWGKDTVGNDRALISKDADNNTRIWAQNGYNAVIGYSNPLYIDEDGQLGIGDVTNPSSLIDASLAGHAIANIATTDASSGARWTAANDNNGGIYMAAWGSAVTGSYFGLPMADLMTLYTQNSPLAIGTNDAYDLTLGTSNTARLTIASTGEATFTGEVTAPDLTLSSPSAIYGLSHDSFADVSANEHVDHTSVSFSAGTGLTGGGDISANRTLSLSHLGIESLSDPGADRVMFWDDSAGAMKWLTIGSGLTLTDTTLSADGGGAVTLADARRQAIIFG